MTPTHPDAARGELRTALAKLVYETEAATRAKEDQETNVWVPWDAQTSHRERRIYLTIADALLAFVQQRERRIECASCRKAPSEDPTVALTRVNIKGIPGVFLCQWCHPDRSA